MEEGAATIAILLPLAVYLRFIERLGVSVPDQDDWSLVPVVRSLHNGGPTSAAPWA
jgi:hypothetical protein